MGRSMMRRAVTKGLRELGRSGIYQRLPDRHNDVLVYHSIGGGGYDDISIERFRAQLEWLQDAYEIVDLPDVLDEGKNKRIALTFDDGLGSFYGNVQPLLREYSIPATVFVVGAAVRDPPGLRFMRRERLMTNDQLREIAADPLVTIGAHTMSHPRLAQLTDEDELREEINDGTECIESALGVSIDRFSYPYYDWSEGAREIVSERHEYAVRGEGTTALIGNGTDPHLIPRVNGAVPLSTLRFTVSDSRKHLARIS